MNSRVTKIALLLSTLMLAGNTFAFQTETTLDGIPARFAGESVGASQAQAAPRTGETMWNDFYAYAGISSTTASANTTVAACNDPDQWRNEAPLISLSVPRADGAGGAQQDVQLAQASCAVSHS